MHELRTGAALSLLLLASGSRSGLGRRVCLKLVNQRDEDLYHVLGAGSDSFGEAVDRRGLVSIPPSRTVTVVLDRPAGQERDNGNRVVDEQLWVVRPRPAGPISIDNVQVVLHFGRKVHFLQSHIVIVFD